MGPKFHRSKPKRLALAADRRIPLTLQHPHRFGGAT